MRAWCYSDYGQAPVLTEVADPLCPADGVVIEVAATGVCRSDWHAWRGHDPVELPRVPGHEFAGTVAQVGTDVLNWHIGQRMTAPYVLACGACEPCRTGDAQVCAHQEQPGFTIPGSFAERIALPRADTNLVALPDGLDFVAAASLGCRFATAFRALTGHGRVAFGHQVAVYGCGGVGLSAVMIAAALGARVVAVDRSVQALQLAELLGAADLVNADEVDDPATTVAQLTDGGAHISIDAVGHPAVAANAVRSLRRRGRHIQVGLLLGAAAMTELPMDRVVSWELEIFGSHGMGARDYPPMLELVASGALDPGRLVGKLVGLEAAGQALAELDSSTGPGMTIVDVTSRTG